MASLKKLKMIDIVELAVRQNLEKKIKELDAQLPVIKNPPPTRKTPTKKKRS